MKKPEDWKPKFLADQNISLKTVSFLRSKNFDVKALGDLNLKGSPDSEIVSAAKNEDRIIITFDKDFGEIYYFSEKGDFTALVLYLEDQTSENVISVLDKFLGLANFESLKNKLIILYKDRIRIIGK